VKALYCERAKVGDSSKYDWVQIIIGEGKNRQIKYMFQKIGFDVKKLKRVAIGQLTLGHLEKGEYAFLDQGGINQIFRKRREETTKRKPTAKRPRKSNTKYTAKRNFR
jgi:23S rRNA pseudouridine2605 synthase